MQKRKNMIIDKRTLESICEQLSEKFHLYEYGYHLAAVFENNDSREIVSWAVLDEDNQIVDTYDKIEDIEKEYYGCKGNNMEVKEVLTERLQNDFRAEQMRTVIGNRIGFLESGLFAPPQLDYEITDKKSQIKAYKDCLNILKKEFFELQLPYDLTLETKLHEIKETIVNKIYPIDDRMRGSKEYRAEYMENQRKAGEIADIIESLCYEMFNQGYEYANEQNKKTE